MILLRAYVRRKRFEARMLAVELGKLLAPRPSGQTDGHIHADDMLQMMGLTL